MEICNTLANDKELVDHFNDLQANRWGKVEKNCADWLKFVQKLSANADKEETDNEFLVGKVDPTRMQSDHKFAFIFSFYFMLRFEKWPAEKAR